MITPVHSLNDFTLNVMKKDEEAFASLPIELRSRVQLSGDPAVLSIELLRGLLANAEMAHDVSSNNRPYAINICGVIDTRHDISPFSAVIMYEATERVTIKRKAWPVGKVCRYMNLKGVFDMYSEEKDSGGEIISFTVTPDDFAADDWVIVDNPNIQVIDEAEEDDYDDDDDDDYDDEDDFDDDDDEDDDDGGEPPDEDTGSSQSRLLTLNDLLPINRIDFIEKQRIEMWNHHIIKFKDIHE